MNKTCRRCQRTYLATAEYFTRQAARLDGLNSNCKECSRAIQKAYRMNDPGKYLTLSRRWRDKNRDVMRKAKREWARRNRHLSNTEAERDRKRILRATRRAKERQAFPAWASMQHIKKIYEHARLLERMSGRKFHVDHIVPISGKSEKRDRDIACGLHCADNLLVVDAIENISMGSSVKDDKHLEYSYFSYMDSGGRMRNIVCMSPAELASFIRERSND